jgi:hypothetical protein
MARSWIVPLSLITLLLLLSGCIDSDNNKWETSIEDETVKALASYPVALTEGQTGTLSVPFVGINFLDTDVKHHWDMPENVTGIIVNVSWQGSGWNIELATGTGECPHQGMKYADVTGSSGELSIEYHAADNQTLEIGQWFCHLAVQDISSHRGESMNYVFDVKLLSYEEVHCEGDVCPV